jgi:hypothetical protein
MNKTNIWKFDEWHVTCHAYDNILTVTEPKAAKDYKRPTSYPIQDHVL